MAQLTRLPGIVAIKESGSGNVDQLFELTRVTGLQVLSGEDAMIFVCACLGGNGAIAAAAHVRPDLFVRQLPLEYYRIRGNAQVFGVANHFIMNVEPVLPANFAMGLIHDIVSHHNSFSG